jgi:hypothetical protein
MQSLSIVINAECILTRFDVSRQGEFEILPCESRVRTSVRLLSRWSPQKLGLHCLQVVHGFTIVQFDDLDLM